MSIDESIGKEIRKYYVKLENVYNEIIKQEIETQKTQFIQDKQQILLKSYNLKCIVYLIKITIDTNGIITYLYKFGNTDDIIKRFSDHTRDINKNCILELIYCIESKNNVELENKLKDYLKNTNYRKEQIFKTHKNKNKKQTELVEIDDIKIIQNELEKLNKPINENLEILKTQEHILELKLELEKLKQSKKEEELEEELDKLQEEEIENLAETTQDELNIKKLKLEELLEKRKQANKRMKKYRQTEKYKLKTQTEEFKKKERERCNKRTQTEESKKYRKEYYQKNFEQIKESKERIRKAKMKTTLVNTNTEKNKFKDWLNLNVNQKIKGNLVWFDLLDKYLNYRTSALISKVYKDYFTEYCTEKYPDISCKFTQFKLNGKNPHGYRNFQIVVGAI